MKKTFENLIEFTSWGIAIAKLIIGVLLLTVLGFYWTMKILTEDKFSKHYIPMK